MNGVSIGRAAGGEFVGTFTLVLSICLTTACGPTSPMSVPLAAGLAVLVMIYAVGSLCGAHFNPAVTAAFWAAGRFPLRRLPAYVAAQIAGATSAAGAAHGIAVAGRDAVASSAAVDTATLLSVTRPSGGEAFLMPALGCEIVLTAILMLVILRVSTGAKEVGVMAGVAVGGTVMLAAIVGGPVSGASLNPARSLGPAIVAAEYTHLWVYFVGPLFGSLAAVPVDRLLGPSPSLCEDRREPAAAPRSAV